MQISVKRIIANNDFKQLLSYFCVGGCASIVEWTCFTFFANVMGINYLLATCFAFVLSTATNWALGRMWTFKDSDAYRERAVLEGSLIYLVSGIGLLFNLGLMYIFVKLLNMNSPIKKVVSKIMATGIVFTWNYLTRKMLIYRSN